MKIFILNAEKNRLAVDQRESVTSGSVNVCQVRFRFSEDWDGLTRTAVFRAGEACRYVVLDGANACEVPWEVLTRPNVPLLAGVCGVRGGEVVLPTVWASLGLILEGAAIGTQEAARPPAPELWEQELAMKGDALGFTEEGELGLYAGARLLSRVPVSQEPAYEIGHGLKVEDGRLSVDAVSDFQGDNTLPMTAAGVETVVGGIDALLRTI